jgi:putative IMPACT (imprinted ancient) family translation regulator
MERSHDAGEPRGTAGPPILQAIRRAGLLGAGIVVSRYFGGTRLGKGGLARAYRDAAARALRDAPRARTVARCRLRIEGPLERDGEIRHLLARHGGRVTAATYPAGKVLLEVVVPERARQTLADDLQALTRGAAAIESVG